VPKWCFRIWHRVTLTFDLSCPIVVTQWLWHICLFGVGKIFLIVSEISRRKGFLWPILASVTLTFHLLNPRVYHYRTILKHDPTSHLVTARASYSVICSDIVRVISLRIIIIIIILFFLFFFIFYFFLFYIIIIIISCPVDHLGQFASKSDHSLWNCRFHTNEWMDEKAGVQEALLSQRGRTMLRVCQ